MSSGVRLEFTPKDAPIVKAVVYRDRAEVTRILRLETEVIGQHEIVLVGVPTAVDSNSLRVEGRGSGTIKEVNVSSNYVAKSNSSGFDQKEKKLRENLDLLQQKKTIEELEEVRLVKKLAFWDKCTESLASGVFSAKDGKTYPATQETYSNITEFLNFQSQESRKLDEQLLGQRRTIRALTEETEAAERNLNDCCGDSRSTWNILVTVDVPERKGAAVLELMISYIVYSAQWSPTYDVRLSNDRSNLSVQYYGEITQNTGEDWVDVKISLSTATPSVGGNIPTLGTKQVSFKVPYVAPRPEALFAAPRAQAFGFGSTAVGKFAVQQSAPMMNMQQVVSNVVSDSGITTSFDISSVYSIPSDGSGHKVTVTIIQLPQPHLQYKCVPKKAEHAFLEAKVINNSQYPILPGPASIFFESSFIGTITLKAVSPQEEFSCSLGADPAIKVRYRPVRRFAEQTGLLSRSNVVTYIQEMEINNTRPDAIHIVIVDQAPRSTEEKLKVTLLEPPISRERTDVLGFVLNQDNNIEHSVDIKEKTSYVWTVKYKLEYPSDKEIEETEVQGNE